jgi:hypothetical protein
MSRRAMCYVKCTVVSMGSIRTTVQVGPDEHAGLARVQAQLTLDTGRRPTLAQVIAELLRAWAGQRQQAGR